MTNGMKKLDEYNLMVLREQLSLPTNKYCFDCHQRGPTYVNVTIGSFVCTSCSGLLRGLTPPHRVKSISMATFSTEEIDFIKSRGNEKCQMIWLGMYGSKQLTKDEKQIKDFMVDKYERKIYYSDPASQKLDNDVQSIPTNTTVSSTTYEIPSSNSTPAINISTPNNKFDFFKDDPFTSNQHTIQTSQSFANFDDNPAFSSPFDSSKNIGVAIESTSPSTSWKSNGFQAPAEDRYAALKDLDCLMKSQIKQESPPPFPPQLENSNSSAWSSDASLNGTWGNQVSENTTHNPFKSCTQDNWASSNVINPFTNDKEDDWQNNIQWPNSLTSSQSLDFNDTKPWSADFSNPFKVGSTSSLDKQSSNPFL